MSNRDILTEIKNKQRPVIIYGAGVVGKALLSLLENEGIEVDCFCDASFKVAESDFCGKQVILTPDLRCKYEDAVFVISVAAIKDVVERLHNLGYANWYAGGLLLKDLNVSQGDLCTSIDYPKFAIETCIYCHDQYLDPGKLSLRSIDIIITERCSLRCRDCSNLMQYYAKPKDCDTDLVLKSIDAFCSVFDEVIEFRIIGGEAFMNRDWPVIVKRLTDEPKGKRVVIYSNATFLPDRKKTGCLKHPKVLLNITDYGPLSRKFAEFKGMLESSAIAYHVIASPGWLDCSSIIPHRRSREEKIEVFKNCCAKNMATLSDGKLHRCPYGANALRLSAVSDERTDYVDLFEKPLDAEGVLAMKSKVRDYLWHREYLEVCDFCRGRPLAGPEVEAAVQIDEPLSYQRYSQEQISDVGCRV
jgi:hypothetical protein